MFFMLENLIKKYEDTMDMLKAENEKDKEDSPKKNYRYGRYITFAGVIMDLKKILSQAPSANDYMKAFLEERKKGMNWAWTYARKIVADVEEGGYSYDELEDIFGKRSIAYILTTYSASEAIAKIRKHEDKKKHKNIVSVMPRVKIITNGNCLICGNELSENRIFLCKECEKEQDQIDKQQAAEWITNTYTDDITCPFCREVLKRNYFNNYCSNCGMKLELKGRMRNE